MNSKLNPFISTLLITLWAIPMGTAIAADEHAAHHPAVETATVPPAEAMANMQKMREQMAAVRANKDPRERARLMDEHMQSMQSTMKQMKQDKGRMMMGNGMAMKDGQAAGGMSMMHMMMEQMQQHQEAMRGAGK